MEGVVNNRKITKYWTECLHYDLDFLNPGEPWPPKIDEYRLERYEFQREQFELDPWDQLVSILPDGLLDLRDYRDFAHVVRLLGYPRLLTLKTVDMVIGQPPTIAVQDDDVLSDEVRIVRANSQLNTAMKQALIDYSRFGVFLLRAFKDEKGEATVTSWDPAEWYPVFYPDGTNRIRYNVIAWKHNNKLTVQIHCTLDGRYEEREYMLDETCRIGPLRRATTYNTTSGKQLLFAVTNTPTSTNPLGTNDYEIINGPLQKAIQRLTAILRVLDEHADPSMTGPHSLLSKNDQGRTVFYSSKYYATGKDEQKPEYLTWDGKLDSSFQAFDELCKQIYILSEMGEAFLGAGGGSGNVVSGTAMRFKMISPLEKARRIGSEITEPLKNLMSTLMHLAGTDVEASKISITFQDSLPKDPRETAELARLESGAPSIKPLFHALVDNYGLDMRTAEHYVKSIIADQETFAQVHAQPEDTVNPTDGRSQSPTKVDSRMRGSVMNPATSENHSEDPDGEA